MYFSDRLIDCVESLWTFLEGIELEMQLCSVLASVLIVSPEEYVLESAVQASDSVKTAETKYQNDSVAKMKLSDDCHLLFGI